MEQNKEPSGGQPKPNANEDTSTNPTGTPGSLEAMDATATTEAPDGVSIKKEKGNSAANAPTLKHRGLFGRLVASLNIYLLLFALLLVVAGASGGVFYLKQNNQNNYANNLSSQPLSQSALQQLANSDVTVGEPQHTLNVQSNALFAGDVLVRRDLQIAGALQVGSGTAINGIRVSGNSVFDDVQIKKSFALSGNASIQGQATIQGSLNVNGSGTFLGAISAPQITVGALQLSEDLNLTHHITAGGNTPTRNNGAALGSGGTVSVSGSDTAGSVSINTGSGPAPGCFVTVNFAKAFNNTPHIVVTPVGSSTATLQYYINRTTANFSICTITTPPAGSTLGFDYIAFD